MQVHFCLIAFFASGCTVSDPVPEELAIEQFLKDATESQLPCSQLQEGKRVPKSIQLGACKDDDKMLITLHRTCPNGKEIHNNTVGWWTNDNVFHKGELSLEQTVDCYLK